MKHPFDFPMAKYAHNLCLEEADAIGEVVMIDDGPWEQLMSQVMFCYWGEIIDRPEDDL